MNKFRILLHSWETRVEHRWQRLSARKQRQYVILFFTGYLLLTSGVVMTVWYDAKTAAARQKPAIDHIHNPVVKQHTSRSDIKDSSRTLIKNRDHER